MCNTVQHKDEEIAIAHGVQIVQLLNRPTCTDHVAAVSYFGGTVIRVGHRLWVLSELEKMGVAIIG